jgi:hypothetical protein
MYVSLSLVVTADRVGTSSILRGKFRNKQQMSHGTARHSSVPPYVV